MQHTTNSSKKILAVLTAGLFASGTAMAASPTDYIKIDDVIDRTDDRSIAIGMDGTSAKDQSSIAVGTGVSADGNGAIAIGSYAKSSKKASTAVGQGTEASQDSATAVGQKAKSLGAGSTAVGSAAQATVNAAAAFGSGAAATGLSSTAIGQAATASAGNTIAIGQKTVASASTATAIGSGATASGVNSIANGTASSASSNFSIATGNRATSSSANAIATGNSALASGSAAIATGANAAASGGASVATGLSANASGGQAIAIGRNAAAPTDFSVALGSYAATEDAVGTNEATVNGVTYSGFAGNSPTGTVSVGNADQKRTVTNVAAGRVTADSTDAVNGSQLYLVANNLKSDFENGLDDLENRANLAIQNQVAAGDNVVVTPSTNAAGNTVFTVSSNGSTTSAGSDYVSVTPTATTGANGATNTTYAVDLSDRTKAAIEKIYGLDDRLDDMEDDLRAGIAGATAIAFLQRPNEAGKSIVSAAVGGFRDQQALAIGYARNSDNNKWSIKAGVGINTRKDVNWGGSIGYQW